MKDKTKKYHTVFTVPQSNRKIIEINDSPPCPSKKNHTTLSEQFHNLIGKS